LLKWSREEGAWLTKSKIDVANFIKVHYMHVVNITMNPLCTIYTVKK
jgi:hypothetical protein